MNDSVKLLYLIALMLSSIVFTYLTSVILSFINTLAPPFQALDWIIHFIVIIFACILVIFTCSLYVLVLMVGITEARNQLLSFKLKRKQLQQSSPSVFSRNPSTVQKEIRRRQQSQFRRSARWPDIDNN